MSHKMVFAIIREERLERVEQALNELCVPGISVSRVKGYGEYLNFYSRDWMLNRRKVTVLVKEEKVPDTVEAIKKAAYSGVPGDGVIAVLPVEQLIHIEDSH